MGPKPKRGRPIALRAKLRSQHLISRGGWLAPRGIEKIAPPQTDGTGKGAGPRPATTYGQLSRHQHLDLHGLSGYAFRPSRVRAY